MGEQELKDIIDKHGKWLRSENGGSRADLSRADLSDADLSNADLSRADLSDADLRGANLRGANLRGADLSGANLSGANLSSANLSDADLSRADLSNANLRGANLRGADLSGANLSGANLSSADLREIKLDFLTRLALAKNEAAGLYDYMMRGKVDGTSYEDECACFVGTIAKVTKESYQKLSCGLKPDSSSLTERWFLAIRKGDVPSSNQVSKITCEWVEEFCKAEGITLPVYELVARMP